MKTNYIKTLLLLLLVIIVNSCEEVDELEPVDSLPLNTKELSLNIEETSQLMVREDIDNTESITWSSDNSEVATVDKKGIVTAISSGKVTITASTKSASGTSVVTVNPDVYILVAKDTGSIQRTLFKNGKVFQENFHEITEFSVTEKGVYAITERKLLLNNKVILDVSNEANFTKLYDLFVDGDHVYVCGAEIVEGPRISKAILWKNGVKTILDSGFSSFAVSLFVENDDVYVFGSDSSTYDEEGDPQAVIYWKNGVKNSIAIESNDDVNYQTFFVKEADIYFGGSSYNIEKQTNLATVWKNGVRTKLSDVLGRVNSVFVEGDNVYCAGFINVNGEKSNPVLWKNGELNQLVNSPDNDYAVEVLVKNDDVYTLINSFGKIIDSSTNTYESAIFLLKNEQEIFREINEESYYYSSIWGNLFLH